MVDDGRFAELEASRDAHDHFGLLYGSRREQLDVVVPFVQRGLDRGDRVVYAFDDTTPAEIGAALRAAGVDVETARESGALTFRDATDIYLTDGEFDRDGAVERVEALAAAADEYESLRIAAEMTGSLLERIDPENVLAYEAAIDCLFEGIDLVGLCQYDRSTIPRSFLEDVVESHPRLAYDGVVGSNAYYRGPAADDPSASALAEKLEEHRRTVAAERSLQRRESGIAAMVCATEELLWADPDEVPDVVAEATRSALGCDHASLWLYDRESDALECRSRSSAGPSDSRIVANDSPSVTEDATDAADDLSSATDGQPDATDKRSDTTDKRADAADEQPDGASGRSDPPAEAPAAERASDGHDDRRGRHSGPSAGRRSIADLAWEAFVTNDEQRRRDADDSSRAGAGRPAGDGRPGAVALPLAGTGALVAATGTADGISRDGVEIARALAGVASLAFEKARQERRLEALHEERTRIATAETILRDLVREAADATSRRDVERTLCETLAQVDDVAFVWSGAVDPDEETATPRAWAGEERDYLSEAVADGTAPAPVVDAVSSAEPTVVSRIADEHPDQPWSRAALDRGFRSVASVPLCNDQLTYGAVTVYASRPEAFADGLEGPIADVGRFVGSLLDVVERDASLRTGQPREVELELSAPEFPFVELAAELECRLEVDDVVSHGDSGVVAVAQLPADVPDRVADAADATDAVEQAEVVEESDDGVLLDLSLADEFVGATLWARGATITSLTADPESARIVVETPEAVGERTVVDTVAEQYARPTLLATRTLDSTTPRGASPATVGGQFTDRQRQVAAVAYHAGYFDSPRRCTGEEVADVLDISPQAFYQHLRRMERTLFDQVVTGS